MLPCAKQFLKAAVPIPYTVLGLKLRPLSIGHITLMQFQGLAYGAGQRPKIEDLICACLICSMNFREYQQFLQRKDVVKQIRKRGKGVDVLNCQAKFKLFDAYLSDGTECPDFQIPDAAADGLVRGAPWLQCLRVALMSKLHVHHEETWDYPYRQAVWDVCTLREAEGGIRIVEPRVMEDNSAEGESNASALQAANDELRKALALDGIIIPGNSPLPTPNSPLSTGGGSGS